jgi:hypothetical protein
MIRCLAHTLQFFYLSSKLFSLMFSFVAPINVLHFCMLFLGWTLVHYFHSPPFFGRVSVCSLIKFGKVSTLKKACGYMSPLKVASCLLCLIVVVVRLATSQLPPPPCQIISKLFYFIFSTNKKNLHCDSLSFFNFKLIIHMSLV